jgi:hypothetical protein
MNNPDLIVGHPFQPGRWPDTCSHQDENGWMCGFSRIEHLDQGDDRR